jgi:hypothetical protein
MANPPKLRRNGAVGFINWLDLLFEQPTECQTNHDAQSDYIGHPSTVDKSRAYVNPALSKMRR